ncbi:MAG: molecular chaperone DnaJ [Mycoplasmataceae bacterium RC_NB112A]|nr:MAG: molecular chaperone DnaJ [Mycoplasmataceae bacterium RC_NB112A]
MPDESEYVFEDGAIKQYGCGSMGYEIEIDRELPVLRQEKSTHGKILKTIYRLDKCSRCNCPKDGSPVIEAEKVEAEDNWVDIDWSFDYWQVFRLKEGATRAQIKAQYIKLCRWFHSDKYAALMEEQKKAYDQVFKDVQKAYDVLKNDDAVQRYNQGVKNDMQFKCPGCDKAGRIRKKSVRSASSLRFFHSPDCAKAWNETNGYVGGGHNWEANPDGSPKFSAKKKPKEDDKKDKPKKICAGCNQEKWFSPHWWVSFDDTKAEGYCCSEVCLGAWLRNQGKPITECSRCHSVRKKHEWNRWAKSPDMPGMLFCSRDCLKEAWKSYKDSGLGNPGGGSNINQERADFIAKLESLTDWNLLSESEQNDFANQVKSSQPDQFDNILRKVQALIATKRSGGGGGDPLLPLKNEAIAEIEREMLKEPAVENSELEAGHQNWATEVKNAISESSINSLKAKVTADIKAKREAKKIPALQQKVIQQIKTELSHNPPVSSSELSYSNWERAINEATTESAIVNIRDHVLAEIKNKRAEKLEVNKIVELLVKAKQPENWNNYANLENILKQIKELRSSNAYAEKEVEIKEVEKRLLELDSNKFKETVSQSLDKQIKDNGLTENKLSKETKEAIAEAKKDPANETKRTKAEEGIAVDGATESLNNILAKVKKVVSKKDKQDLINEIMTFISRNKFSQKAYQKQKDKVKSALSELRGENKDQGQQPGKKPFPYLTLTICLIGAVLIGILALILYRKKRRNLVRW